MITAYSHEGILGDPFTIKIIADVKEEKTFTNWDEFSEYFKEEDFQRSPFMILAYRSFFFGYHVKVKPK